MYLKWMWSGGSALERDGEKSPISGDVRVPKEGWVRGNEQEGGLEAAEGAII
jgi:hypothetical protein